MRKLIRHILKEETNEFELVKNFIYTMYDNVKFVEYIAKRNEVMVYYTNHGKQQMLIPTEICELISNYTGLDVVPWHTDRESDNQPDFYLDTEEYEEKINENYSPAGKEITPNKIVIHKSNPKFRDRISNEGLKASAGDCYKIYAGYGEKCIPAIFATNSTNKRAWFDSTYDDDVWEINTEMIPNVKWYKDRHFESTKKHIVTFDNIPVDAITLKHEGTGKDWGLMESIDKSEDMGNDIEKNLKVIRMLLKQVNWEGLCDIWVEYDYLDKEYAIKSKYVKKDLRTNNDIQKELVFLGNVIRSMGIMVYIYGPWYVEDCEDEVEFMNESLNESEKDTKKLFKVINNIIDDLILSEYDHIICSYDVKLDEVFNEPVVDVTFIGGYGTKLFPVTQGVQKMYYDILDKIWSEIYDHINIPVGVTMKTTPKCDDQLNESEIKEGKYISVLKDFTEQFKDEDCGKKNIYLKESIRKVLKEETDGVNTLIDDITSRHEMSDKLIEKVKDFISQSNCKKIEFANFKMPAMGIALHDGVLINKIALNQRLEYLLFIIFHETAHQYQFKKYGEDLMYECYLGDISVEEAAKLMKHTEEVADEFAGKKIKQLQKQGLLDKGFTPPWLYKNAPMSQIIAMVGFYRSQLKQQNITTPDKISEFFYNMVKNNI